MTQPFGIAIYSMPTNQLFSLNFTISNQSASDIKSEIRPLICQRTHYGNLERQKRFKSSSFQITAAMFFKFCKLILKIIVALDNNSTISNTRATFAYYSFCDKSPAKMYLSVSCHCLLSFLHNLKLFLSEKK